MGGLLLGVVKMALILSLLLGAFETVNRSAGWVGEQSYARAVLYKPVREVSVSYTHLDVYKRQGTSGSTARKSGGISIFRRSCRPTVALSLIHI